MAKYGNTHYLQLSRDLFTDEYDYLSNGAKWLFVVLNELEQRYTTGKKDGQDFFFRSDAELAADAGMGITTLKRHKAELKGSGLVEISKIHFVDSRTHKKSEKKITAYRILK